MRYAGRLIKFSQEVSAYTGTARPPAPGNDIIHFEGAAPSKGNYQNERKEIIKQLNELIQLDADAVEAYDHAIKRVEYDDLSQDQRHLQYIREILESPAGNYGNPLCPHRSPTIPP